MNLDRVLLNSRDCPHGYYRIEDKEKEKNCRLCHTYNITILTDFAQTLGIKDNLKDFTVEEICFLIDKKFYELQEAQSERAIQTVHSSLPSDIVKKILFQQPIDKLLSLCKTEKFSSLCQQPSFWIELWSHHFPNVKHPFEKSNNGEYYKKVYLSYDREFYRSFDVIVTIEDWRNPSKELSFSQGVLDVLLPGDIISTECFNYIVDIDVDANVKFLPFQLVLPLGAFSRVVKLWEIRQKTDPFAFWKNSFVRVIAPQSVDVVKFWDVHDYVGRGLVTFLYYDYRFGDLRTSFFGNGSLFDLHSSDTTNPAYSFLKDFLDYVRPIFFPVGVEDCSEAYNFDITNYVIALPLMTTNQISQFIGSQYGLYGLSSQQVLPFLEDWFDRNIDYIQKWFFYNLLHSLESESYVYMNEWNEKDRLENDALENVRQLFKFCINNDRSLDQELFEEIIQDVILDITSLAYVNDVSEEREQTVLQYVDMQTFRDLLPPSMYLLNIFSRLLSKLGMSQNATVENVQEQFKDVVNYIMGAPFDKDLERFYEFNNFRFPRLTLVVNPYSDLLQDGVEQRVLKYPWTCMQNRIVEWNLRDPLFLKGVNAIIDHYDLGDFYREEVFKFLNQYHALYNNLKKKYDSSVNNFYGCFKRMNPSIHLSLTEMMVLYFILQHPNFYSEQSRGSKLNQTTFYDYEKLKREETDERDKYIKLFAPVDILQESILDLYDSTGEPPEFRFVYSEVKPTKQQAQEALVRLLLYNASKMNGEIFLDGQPYNFVPAQILIDMTLDMDEAELLNIWNEYIAHQQNEELQINDM